MKPFFENLIVKKYSYLAALSHAVKVQLSLTMSFQMITFSSEAQKKSITFTCVYLLQFVSSQNFSCNSYEYATKLETDVEVYNQKKKNEDKHPITFENQAPKESPKGWKYRIWAKQQI